MHSLASLAPLPGVFLFWGHDVHNVAPSVSAYVPVSQARQTVATERFEYFPVEHLTHADSSIFPAVGAYLPGPQALHALIVLAPVAEEYLPTTHSTQRLSAARPSWPEYFPAEQGKQRA